MPQIRTKTPTDWRKEIALILLFNSLIAVYLATVYIEDNFLICLGFSQIIGFSIYSSVKLMLSTRLCDYNPLIPYSLGITIGSCVGVGGSYIVLNLLLQTNLAEHLQVSRSPESIMPSIFTGLFFGSAIGYFFYSKYKLLETGRELAEQQRERSELERAASVSQLKVLQAQIEPHFLHNILANVISLIDSDPKLARQMLQRLAELLRVALKRTRTERISLREELEFVESYLQIQQIRLGARLHYRIDAEPQALVAALPPLAIQPLVENSLRHGIEPSQSGGQVIVKASVANDKLHISVSDDGVGLDQDSIGGSGVSLNNLRGRLASLYGAAASLHLSARQPSGVLAQVQLPISEL